MAKLVPVEEFDLIIFGGTGDLARRKLLPALYHRDRDGQFTGDSRIISTGRRAMSRDEYLAMARESRDLDQLEVDCDADARATDVLLDRIRFPLAVTNLIDNAYKFSRTPDQAEVLLRLRRVGEQVHLEVHDDGIGIADTLGDHVFERFTQGDMTATREFQGAGLGLAVVREIVTAHDGRVQLVSPVLNGTAIRIALPVAGGG